MVFAPEKYGFWRAKRGFLHCKKWVFALQEVGFCIAKVWFLFFECCVVAICLECYHNPFAAEWQSVRNVLAIRQPCFGNPSAMFWQTVSHVLANRSQYFGNPFAMFWQTVSSRREAIYRARIYENTHKMTNGYVRALK